MLHAKKKSTFVLLNKKKANVKAQLPKQHKAGLHSQACHL